MDLLQLPPELLIRVSSYLNTVELGCFRRTCKDIESSLFESFAREFFTKRQFMIEQVSLQALIDIANHPTLSERVSEVIISTHTFHAEDFNKDEASHDVLLATGQARDMLVEAFSKLPNLRVVGLRDYHARGRIRDGRDALWKSYGWSRASIGDALALNMVAPDNILPLMLYALGCANARPESVEIFLRRHLRLTPASTNVFTGFMADKVIPVLRGLKTIMLTIATCEDIPYINQAKEYGSMSESLIRLFHGLPNLETLRLNFRTRENYSMHFLDWLSKPASVTDLDTVREGGPTNPVRLENLTRLDLGSLIITVPLLVNLLTKFDLESINLWKVTLVDDVRTDGDTDHWALFFLQLAKALPDTSSLKHMLVGFPSVSQLIQARRLNSHTPVREYSSPHPVRFASIPESHNNKIQYRAAQDSNIKDWLRLKATDTIFESSYEENYLDEDDSEDQSIFETDEEHWDSDEEDEEDPDDPRAWLTRLISEQRQRGLVIDQEDLEELESGQEDLESEQEELD